MTATETAERNSRAGRRYLTMDAMRSSIRPLLSFTLLAVCAVSGGCQSSPGVPADSEPPRRELSLSEKRDAAKRVARRKARAVAVNRHLIYTPRWTRAEDLATTLQPLLQNMYGPSALAHAHVASNKLFVYMPDERERESGSTGATRSRGATRSTGRGGGRTQAPPTTGTGSRTGRSQRGTTGRR